MKTGGKEPILKPIFIEKGAISMKACPDRAAALALLRKYNAEPFHIQHGLTV